MASPTNALSPLIVELLRSRGLGNNPLDPLQKAFANPVNRITGVFGGAGGAISEAQMGSAIPFDSDLTPYPATAQNVNIGPSTAGVGNVLPSARIAPPSPAVMPSASPQNGATGPFDAFLGDTGGYGNQSPYTPGKRPELLPITQQTYNYPDAPTAPSYLPMPQRNLAGEQKVVRGGMTKAGLLGLLLGGAQGAVAGAGGYQQGAEGALDAQYGNQAQGVQRQNQVLQQGYKDASGQYGDRLDAIKLQMAGDDKDNTLAEQINSHRMNEYTRDEGNRIKVYNSGLADRAKAAARQIAQQRADTGDDRAMSDFLLKSAMIDNYVTQATQRGEQIDNRFLVDMLGIGIRGQMAGIAQQNADSNTLRAKNQASHYKALEDIGRTRNGISQERVRFMNEHGGSAGSKPLTFSQKSAIEEELARSAMDIAKMRDPGKAPDKFKDAEGYNQWISEKGEREKTAQEYRGYLNDRAAAVGKVFDDKTGRYVLKNQPKATSAPVTLENASSGLLSGLGFSPRSMPTAEGRGQKPTINPAAQSGNREAVSRAATPKTSATSKPSPKPSPKPSRPPVGKNYKSSASGRTFEVVG